MRGGPYVDLILVRLLFVLVVAVTCYVIAPFGLPSKLDAGVGALVGLAIVLFEWRLRRGSLALLLGAAITGVLGIFGASSIAPGVGRQILFNPYTTSPHAQLRLLMGNHS